MIFLLTGLIRASCGAKHLCVKECSLVKVTGVTAVGML